MKLLTHKDIADEMGCCVATVKIRARIVKVLPTFQGNCAHRWSREQADLLILKWSKHTQQNAKQSPKAVGTRPRNFVPEKVKGNRRDGQRAGNRAGHQSADGKRQPATQRAGR